MCPEKRKKHTRWAKRDISNFVFNARVNPSRCPKGGWPSMIRHSTIKVYVSAIRYNSINGGSLASFAPLTSVTLDPASSSFSSPPPNTGTPPVGGQLAPDLHPPWHTSSCPSSEELTSKEPHSPGGGLHFPPNSEEPHRGHTPPSQRPFCPQWKCHALFHPRGHFYTPQSTGTAPELLPAIRWLLWKQTDSCADSPVPLDSPSFSFPPFVLLPSSSRSSISRVKGAD